MVPNRWRTYHRGMEEEEEVKAVMTLQPWAAPTTRYRDSRLRCAGKLTTLRSVHDLRQSGESSHCSTTL
jgi:hypothetical protein